LILTPPGKRLPDVQPVAAVVTQHVQDLAILWNVRDGLVRSGAVNLIQISRCDQRIAAHEDGCVVNGPYATRRLIEETIDGGAGPVFAAAVVALDSKDLPTFEHCINICETSLERAPALIAALGWVEKSRLVAVGASLIHSDNTFRRRLGLSACRLHQTDPGPALRKALTDQGITVRAEGLRVVGTLGRDEFLPQCTSAITDEDPLSQLWAAWSAVLLGNRGTALEVLREHALQPGPQRARAFRLALQAMTGPTAHELLQFLARDPQDLVWLIRGSGLVGDSTYVPWLIGHMSDDPTARLAGEAFSLITGADLALLDLERKPPENFESGPSDDADDPNVEMDPDEGLPWPDPGKIEKWWAANSPRFTKGQRYFIGAPVTREHCIEVLKNGYQRQRILAAHYLCLLDPGTPLFNTSAPAWRQQRLLAQMS
jgi:uncharacterized protein (TIGR02270 family)